jgi:hypothetical protein
LRKCQIVWRDERIARKVKRTKTFVNFLIKTCVHIDSRTSKYAFSIWEEWVFIAMEALSSAVASITVRGARTAGLSIEKISKNTKSAESILFSLTVRNWRRIGETGLNGREIVSRRTSNASSSASRAVQTLRIRTGYSAASIHQSLSKAL